MWPYPKIVAHRGGGSLAPENTIAGLRCGLAYGYRAVEFDVMLSRDGMGMVIHDSEFGRTVAGVGGVADTDAGQLAGMDAGAWFGPDYRGERVPAFVEFVDYCKAQRIWMNIEIKPAPGHEAETGRWVGLATAERFQAELEGGDPTALPLLASFSQVALEAARAVAPALPRAWLVDTVPADWQAQARELGVVAVHTNHQHLTRAQVQAIKSAGYGLFCYTVNEAPRARAILDWGVDAFCTDRIDLIPPNFA